MYTLNLHPILLICLFHSWITLEETLDPSYGGTSFKMDGNFLTECYLQSQESTRHQTKCHLAMPFVQECIISRWHPFTRILFQKGNGTISKKEVRRDGKIWLSSRYHLDLKRVMPQNGILTQGGTPWEFSWEMIFSYDNYNKRGLPCTNIFSRVNSGKMVSLLEGCLLKWMVP